MAKDNSAASATMAIHNRRFDFIGAPSLLCTCSLPPVALHLQSCTCSSRCSWYNRRQRGEDGRFSRIISLPIRFENENSHAHSPLQLKKQVLRCQSPSTSRTPGQKGQRGGATN